MSSNIESRGQLNGISLPEREVAPGISGTAMNGAGIATNVTGMNGTAMSGTAMSGTAMGGAAVSGTAMSGTAMSGTAMSGTAMSGTAMSGTAMSGTAMSGTAMSGTAMSGTAMNGTAMNGVSRISPAATIGVNMNDVVNINGMNMHSTIQDLNPSISINNSSLTSNADSSYLPNLIQDSTSGSAGIAGISNPAPIDTNPTGSSIVLSAGNDQQDDYSNTNPQSYLSLISPAPPVPMKIFVGRVPRVMDEGQMEETMEKYGPVKEVVILRDRQTSQHRGSAFVKFDSIICADKCIRDLYAQHAQGGYSMQARYANGEPERLGFASSVDPMVDKAKLFVGSISRTAAKEDIENLFQQFGNIEEVFILRNPTTQESKGCAFVRVSYKEQAIHAIGALDGKCTMDGCTRPLEVRFADNKAKALSTPAPVAESPWKEYVTVDGRPYYHNKQTMVTTWDRPSDFTAPSFSSSPQLPRVDVQALAKSGASGPPGANLFIFHIPNEWTASDLVNCFFNCGHLVSAKIATDKNTGRNRGFGFVSFSTLEAAALAVTHTNGAVVKGKRLKVSVKKGEEHFLAQYMEQMGDRLTDRYGGMNQNPANMNMPMQAVQPHAQSTMQPHVQSHVQTHVQQHVQSHVPYRNRSIQQANVTSPPMVPTNYTIPQPVPYGVAPNYGSPNQHYPGVSQVANRFAPY